MSVACTVVRTGGAEAEAANEAVYKAVRAHPDRLVGLAGWCPISPMHPGSSSATSGSWGSEDSRSTPRSNSSSLRRAASIRSLRRPSS